MKKIILFILSGSLLFLSCTKTTTQVLPGAPAYTVTGIEDVKLTYNGGSGYTSATMPITIQYQDSTQQEVTVSISGIPNGFSSGSTTNGTITKGMPTFSFNLQFLNYSYPGAASGTYPLTITAAGTLSGTKNYTFNLIVP